MTIDEVLSNMKAMLAEKEAEAQRLRQAILALEGNGPAPVPPCWPISPAPFEPIVPSPLPILPDWERIGEIVVTCGDHISIGTTEPVESIRFEAHRPCGVFGGDLPGILEQRYAS